MHRIFAGWTGSRPCVWRNSSIWLLCSHCEIHSMFVCLFFVSVLLASASFVYSSKIASSVNLPWRSRFLCDRRNQLPAQVSFSTRVAVQHTSDRILQPNTTLSIHASLTWFPLHHNFVMLRIMFF